MDKLSHQEARVVDYLQVNQVITTANAQEISGSVNYKQSANLLLRMEKEKLLKKVSRGVYALGIKRVGTQKELKFKIKTEAPKPDESFTFKVENGWKPSKITLNDKFTHALVDAVKGLQKGQSIQLPVDMLRRELNTDDIKSMPQALRSRMKKHISPNYFGNFRVFTEKEKDGSVFAFRIMYYYGV